MRPTGKSSGSRLLSLLVILSVTTGRVAVADDLPEGHGLSARYPFDRGIAGDPAVLVHENFEVDALDILAARWESVSNHNQRVLSLVNDGPLADAGRQALQVTATLGDDTGGHLYRRLPREVETLFARFYVKFDRDAGYPHHFVHLGGYRPATAWPQGGAGNRPAGNERFTVGIEPHGDRGRFAPPGTWTFYAYWPEMKISADGRYWGNGIRPVRPRQIERDRWQCVEVMLKLNSTPESRDGELALWLDGELQAHVAPGVPRDRWTGLGFNLLSEGGEPFEGFRWRTDPNLKINFFWLLHYVTENAARQNRVGTPPPVLTVWFDDIVLATEYIGPIHAPPRNSGESG